MTLYYQNQKCHPSRENQIHSLQTKSLERGSCHGYLGLLHQNRHRKEGSLINFEEMHGLIFRRKSDYEFNTLKST